MGHFSCSFWARRVAAQKTMGRRLGSQARPRWPAGRFNLQNAPVASRSVRLCRQTGQKAQRPGGVQEPHVGNFIRWFCARYVLRGKRRGAGWGVRWAHGGQRVASIYKTPRSQAGLCVNTGRQASRRSDRGVLQEPRLTWRFRQRLVCTLGISSLLTPWARYPIFHAFGIEGCCGCRAARFRFQGRCPPRPGAVRRGESRE